MSEKKKNETKKETQEKNYLRNYIILIIIFIFCIALTLYLCEWFNVYKEYEKETPVIQGSLLEITSEDLEHYVVDTSNVVVYMCTAPSDECRSFEKNLKKYVIKKEITDEIIYLNLTGVDVSEFVKKFNEKYKTKISSNFPSFVVFNDGNVVGVLQSKKNKSISISKLSTFMDLYVFDELEEDYADNLEVNEGEKSEEEN